MKLLPDENSARIRKGAYSVTFTWIEFEDDVVYLAWYVGKQKTSEKEMDRHAAREYWETMISRLGYVKVAA